MTDDALARLVQRTFRPQTALQPRLLSPFEAEPRSDSAPPGLIEEPAEAVRAAAAERPARQTQAAGQAPAPEQIRKTVAHEVRRTTEPGGPGPPPDTPHPPAATIAAAPSPGQPLPAPAAAVVMPPPVSPDLVVGREPEPVITITIGRIDVRADVAPPATPGKRPRERRVMPLQEYLDRRAVGGPG